METLGKMFDAIDARMPLRDWDGLARDLAALVPCDFINYYAADVPEGPRSPDEVVMTTNRDAMTEYYDRGLYNHLVMRESEIPQFAPFKGSDFIAPELYKEQLHYTAWGKNYDCFHMAIAPLMLSATRVLVLVFARGIEKDNFCETDCHRAGLAARYLRRFVQAQGAALPIEHSALTAQFLSPVAILEDGVVSASNEAFDKWCAEHGLAVIDQNSHTLTFTDERLSARVAAELERLQERTSDLASPPKSQIAIAAPTNQGRRFSLQFVSMLDGVMGAQRFMCFIHNANPTLAVSGFGKSLNLTETEIEIFSYLAQGISARDVAEMTERNYATVRWHIQNILTKSGAASQKELLYKLFSETEAG